MTMEFDLDPNLKGFDVWMNIPMENRPEFVAFIDGDPATAGNDFSLIAINASELRAQRGRGAQLAIFDTKSKILVPG